MIRWINRHSEYSEFRQAHRVIRTAALTGVLIFTGEEGFSYGLTVSRKVGGAVKRNLTRRRIKAWMRQYFPSEIIGMKANLIARPGIAEMSWDSLGAELDELCRKLRLASAEHSATK